MNTNIPKPAKVKAPKPHDGTTRPAGAPLDEGAAEAFRAVEPEGFQDHPRASIDDAIADPDVDDSKGGE